MTALFLLCLTIVAWTYLGYPLLAGLRGRFRARAVTRARFHGSFTLVLAAHNEAANLGRRLLELREHIARCGAAGRILVVSDGSTDETAAIARSFSDVDVLELVENVGKAAALTEASRRATGDVLVFADARQTWAEDALACLLENFADPEVGAVSGDLVLESTPGVLAGVGLYWRFEKWLRKQESRAGSQVGVTGAIAAARRELFRAIPPGILLDDVYWPLCVAMEGRRVMHDERAHAFDRLPERSRDEFRRKVRTLAGNLQLAQALPASLVPWRNPIWLAWWSHKLLRLAVPWALLGLLATSALVSTTWARLFLGVQTFGYVLGLLGLCTVLSRRSRLLSAAGSFLVLNAAAWLAFWVWATGRARSSWSKVQYSSVPPPALDAHAMTSER